MICLQYHEAKQLLESIEAVLPYLETAEFEGDIDEEPVEQLQASYDMLAKLAEGL